MSTSRPVIEIETTNYAYGGEVFGRLPDGRIVFIPYSIPGERLRVRLVEEKRSFARAELLEVLTPATERIAPRCAHFGECGGCHYQHMPYEHQLAAKKEVLKDQFQRIGRMGDTPVGEIVPCEETFNYRNYVQFHLAPDGSLGYHQPLSRMVLPIQECHLPETTLNQLWPQLDFEAGPGLERVGLRLGAGEDVQIHLESRQPVAPELSVHDLPVSVVHLSPAGELVLAGSPSLVMDVLERPFQVSASSFFQVNTEMATKMVEHILDTLPEYCELTKQTVLVDAYCGVGLFSAFLAPHVGRLIGIESSASAAGDYVVNLDEFDHVELYEAPVSDVLHHLDQSPQVLLVDPPRAGIDQRVMEGVLQLSPTVLVYVSCDPATLARDARRLTERGYHLSGITPFDLFPQTYHIESISFWTREAR